jgi:hypothetical protein
MKVKLNDVLEALDFVNEETQYYYNMKTEQVVMLMDGMGDEEDAALKDDIDKNYENYIVLPEKYEINEYAMMEDFIDELNDVDKQDRLYSVIRSKGAFRRFKDSLFDLGLEKNWYKFRDDAYLKIATKWCEKNNIETI